MSEDILTRSDVARYLKVSEKTIQRLIAENTIPCVKVGGQWRFLKAMIDNWLLSQMNVVPRESYLTAIRSESHALSIAALIEPSCVHLGMKAADPEELLGTLVASLAEVRAVSDAELFLRQVLEREKIMSTGLGGGIAVPHPRAAGRPPVLRSALAVGYCPEGIGFGAVDGIATRLFLVIASSSDAVHVRILSRLVRFASGDGWLDEAAAAKTPEDFLRLLRAREAEILE